MIVVKSTIVITLIVALVFAFGVLFQTSPSVMPKKSNDEMIREHAPPSIAVAYWIAKFSEQESVPEKLVRRCALYETTYRGVFDWKYDPFSTKQISSADARGPMQILVICARDVWKDSIAHMTDKEVADKLRYDLEWNIQTGVKHIANLYHKYRNWTTVFSVYNQGWKGADSINSYARSVAKV